MLQPSSKLPDFIRVAAGAASLPGAGKFPGQGMQFARLNGHLQYHPVHFLDDIFDVFGLHPYE